jgi:hypothetical protein
MLPMGPEGATLNFRFPTLYYLLYCTQPSLLYINQPTVTSKSKIASLLPVWECGMEHFVYFSVLKGE